MGKKKEVPGGTFQRINDDIYYVGPYVSVSDFVAFASQHGVVIKTTDPNEEVRRMTPHESEEKPKSALTRLRRHARPFVLTRTGKLKFSTGYKVSEGTSSDDTVTVGLTGVTPHQQDAFLRQLFSHATLEG